MNEQTKQALVTVGVHVGVITVGFVSTIAGVKLAGWIYPAFKKDKKA